MTVGDDDGWAVKGFCIDKGSQGMLVVEAHGNTSHIDVTVGNCHQPQVFLGQSLALGGKTCHCAARGGLGSLATGIRIYLGIEDQQVNIAPGGDDMVKTAVANIVCPAIAADNPNGFFDQGIGYCGQVLGLRDLGFGKFHLEGVDPFALLLDAQIGRLVGFEKAIDQILAKLINEGRQNIPGVLNLLIECQAEAQAEFGVILKQTVGPSRATSFLVKSVRSGRQVTTVNGGAAGGIGNNGSITKQL